MAKRRLPVGIQTFRQIREEGFYYVDKTGYARKLLDGDGKHYGRLDIAVLLAGNAYLFEFKVAERSEMGAALAQLRERGYADKHRVPGRSVHLIGVEVSAENRDLAAFQTEPA